MGAAQGQAARRRAASPLRRASEPRATEPLDLRAAILLVAGGSMTYVAYQHPAFGTALLTGVAVTTLLHALLRRH